MLIGAVRAYLIHNPSAGDVAPSRHDLERAIQAAGFEVRYASTQGNGWKGEVQEPGQIAVIAGGDGTVRKVALAVAGSDVPFALLPFGTANNIAKSLGVRGRLEEIAEGWKGAERRPFDIGLVTYGRQTTRFVEAVGGGIFAELVARGGEIEDSPELVGRETDRALTLLEQITRESEAARWDAMLDGERLEGEFLAFEVANTPFVGPNVPLAVDADSGDGMLDVVVVRPKDREGLLTYLEGRLERGGETAPSFETRRAREVVLRPPKDVALHVDDTRRGWSERVEVTLERAAAHVLVPR
jgi:diacylglycerol kinase (ATP)